MGQIRRLEKNVSDKIAAGEVVERPLSVVKELVENAIDAGSTAISVSITGGGIRQIVVTDNGSGIAGDDVSLAFEKHATSKIFTENDLNFISTQGFRGEALSSIAAVSIIELKTKRKEEELGTVIRISGGRMDNINPAGLPDGTSMSVSNLFYNVPARLKFLKSESHEAAYVSDLMSRYVLAFPEISFYYSSQGKSIYHSPGNGDLCASIYCIYGADLMENIIRVAYDANEVRVEGYVSRPGAVMKNRQKGSVFVNRRFVRNSSLHDMIRSAYGPMLVKGESPFFAINLFLPTSAVDVNVHPNKLQVRFKDTASVEYALKEAVAQARLNVHGSIDLKSPEKTPASPTTRTVELHAPEEVMQTAFFSGFARPAMKEAEEPGADEYNLEAKSDFGQIQKEEARDQDFPDQGEAVFWPYGDKLIGCFADTYILVEQGDNLLIIDQHAAHERLLYDRFVSGQNDASQPLLVPQVIKVSHAQKNLIDENMGVIQSIGFDIEPFGMLEYKISSVPMLFCDAGVTELINEMMGELTDGEGDIVLKRDRIIRAACKSAVKAGDKLSYEELRSLVDSFLKTNVIPTCPHGRPVISLLTKKQIEKSFKRVL
jgi:DNA mismatch repair protein MutL